MDPDDPGRFDEWRLASGRRSAVMGALLAALVMLGAALLLGEFRAWLLVPAGLALLASTLLVRDGLPARPAAAVSSVADRLAHVDAVLANIPDPVILVDRRAVVLEANDAARRLLPGIRERQPLSYALRAPDVLDAVETVGRNGQPLTVAYSERVPSERSFEVLLGRLTGPSSEAGPMAAAIVLFFRDLTAARRLEQLRADFVANASHELRTPLAALLGFIETLQGPARNDEAARERFLAIMRAQAERMRRLIDDLLSLSRIEMAVHRPPAAEVDLTGLVRQIVDVLGPSAKEHGVAIRLAFAEEPLTVTGDRDELLRLVENLVENAIKYGESGGKVEIGVARAPDIGQGPRIELGIRDHGPGIAPEHLPRLTERFYRADPALSRDKGGTGLGLAIVKHIVTHHRGRLIIESEPGQGALFRVFLPEHPAAAARPLPE